MTAHRLHRLAWVAVALCAAPWAHATIDHCVSSASGFNSAIKDADDDETIVRVVQGTYALPAFQQARDAGGFNRNLTIIGGYTDDTCSERTVDPQYTVIDGTGATDEGQIASSANITIESLTLRNYPHGLYFYLHNAITDTTLTLDRVVLEHECASGSCTPGTAPVFVQGLDYLVLSQVIVANNAYTGCAFYLRTSSLNEAQVVNSVFASNGGRGLCAVDGFGNTSWTLEAYNNIFWGNGGSDLYTRDSDDIHLLDNIVHATNMSPAPAAAPAGSLDQDPKFINPAADNFYISLVSPAVNSGSNTVPGVLPAQDIAGAPRLMGSRVDRGPYETIVDDTLDITVTTALDTPGTCPSSTNCSLRKAINMANSAGGWHHILFNIPGSGCEQHIITLGSPLPDVVSAIVIDGYSQSGSKQNTLAFGTNAVVCVGLYGSFTFDRALRASDGQLTLDGIGFGGFTVAAVELTGGFGHQIWGNQFGGSVGANAIGNQPVNIEVSGSAQISTIGGSDRSQVNLIGAAFDSGIVLGGNGGNKVYGNLIGTSATGNGANPNTTGLTISSAYNDVRYNVISGNSQDGILLTSTSATVNYIAQNRIGMKGGIVLCLPGTSCTFGLPNFRHGIRLENGAYANLMSYNTIAYNGAMGVSIGSGRGNNLAYDTIYANAQYGIDLDGSGLNDNDGDPATLSLPNRGLNFPVVQQAYGGPHSAWIDGYLATTNGTYAISVYASPSCDNTGYGEGQYFLGGGQVTISNASAGLNGFAPMHVQISAPSLDLTGKSISALATSNTGDVSEFAACRAYNCDVIFRHDFDKAAGEKCPTP